jgi:multidrug resistance efflux pump
MTEARAVDPVAQKPESGAQADEAELAAAPADEAEAAAMAEASSAVPPAPKNTARKVVLVTVGVLVVFYIYDVIADRITPYTSQAAVDSFLVQIAPEVTGQVEFVGVTDNSAVKKGQVLFRIDQEPFEIALRSARANLAAAMQAADVSYVEITVAQAQLDKQRVDLAASRALGGIVNDLVDGGALAKTNAIRANADTAKTAADVAKGEAEVARAQRKLGGLGLQNVGVQQAMAAVQQAQLDLSNTTVTATADGVVTNLRLATGQFVSRGQPLLSFINDGPRWITADMRENQLGNLVRGNRVLTVLDQQPGRIFEGRVESIGWGITQGDEVPTGQLPDVQTAAGWLREPQRFPVRIILEDGGKVVHAAAGRSGAQANVMILTEDSSILNPIGRVWMWIVSIFSYLR